MTKLKEGDVAPPISGLDQDGNEISLALYKNKKVVVFFYPKDNTPTCTVESCNLRDNYQLLKKNGIEVIGVSADSQRKHQNFIQKFSLPYKLLADTERAVIEAYGVWGEKRFMGRTFDGIHRKTFVIDENGKIEKIIDKVKSSSHAEQILAELNIN